MTRASSVETNVPGHRLRYSRIGSNSPRDENGRLVERLNDFGFHKYTEHDSYMLCTSRLDPRHSDFVRHQGHSFDESNVGENGYYAADHRYKNIGTWPSETDVFFSLRRKIAIKDWNALTDLAEIQSTVNGLAQRAKRIGDAFRSLRKGDLGSFGRALDVSIPPSKRRKAGQVRANISGHLLEYQFAIVPIYQSMYDGAVSIYEARQRNPKHLVSASLKHAGTEEYSHDRHIWIKNLGMSFGVLPQKHRSEWKKRVKAITEVQIINPDLAYVSEFGLANPLATAYAVLPNSWLFDFFYPLGGFLEQLYMPPGIVPGRTLVISAHSATSVAFHASMTKTLPYLGVNQYNQGTRLNAEISADIKGNESSYVWISSTIRDFPGVQYPSLKLPFLGQALTGFAYADQQSKKIKEALTYKGIR